MNVVVIPDNEQAYGNHYIRVLGLSTITMILCIIG